MKITYHPAVQKTLGERKYPIFNDALNEAVQNCLDNKPSRIDILIKENEIIVEDDGVGMNRKELEDDYLCIGKPNPDPEKGGLFGIGILANRALANKTILETHLKGSEKGIQISIDWNKVDQEIYDVEDKEIDSPIEKHGTKLKLVDLQSGVFKKIKEFDKYIGLKRFALLVNPKRKVNIYVNGKMCKSEEPEFDEKIQFSSKLNFPFKGKVVPAQPNAKFGKVEGIIYFSNKAIDSEIRGVHIFDRVGQRIDTYSKQDWLGLRNLTSGSAFSNRIVGIINVETETIQQDNISIFDKNCLVLKADRSAFFEDTISFDHLKAYLNEAPKGEELNLPRGGVFRLIHNYWYQEHQSEKAKLRAISAKVINEKLKPLLNDLLKDIKFVWKTAEESDEEREKPRKKIKTKKEYKTKIIRNKLLKCPECEVINKVSILIYELWKIGDEKVREKNPVFCNNCTNQLNPLKDLYKYRSPAKKPKDKIITKVQIGKGKLVDIDHQSLGKDAGLAEYLIDDEVLIINDEHVFYQNAVKYEDENMLLSHTLNASFFAIAKAKSEEENTDFFDIYNYLCAIAHEKWLIPK